MKRIRRQSLLAICLVALFLVGAAWLLVWTVPALQDALMKRAMLAKLSQADNSALLADNALHIFLCGTGSPLPDPTRASACTAVMAGGHVVLIDSGMGSWLRIVQGRLPVSKIATVLLTHLHSDHINGLGELAMQTWLGGRNVPLEVFGPSAPEGIDLPLNALGRPYGTSGTTEVVQGFTKAYDADAAFRIVHHGIENFSLEGARMVAHDIPTPAPGTLVTVFEKDGLKISAFLVHHHPIEPAFGYRIEYGDRVAVVSGDTKKSDSVERFSKNADLLVHEALSHDIVNMIVETTAELGDKKRAGMMHDTLRYHTSPVEAAEIANKAQVKLLVISHLVPPTPNALARRIFMRGVADARGKGETILGYDGLMITLPSNSRAIETSSLY